MKYSTILADPAWSFSDKGSRIAPDELKAASPKGVRHYNTLTDEELYGMGDWVKELAADDCFLFLWTPNSFLLPKDEKAKVDSVAVQVAREWGFVPRQIIPWVKVGDSGKPQIGMGHYTRVCTEMLLLCRRGKAKVVDRGVPGVIIAPRTKHSSKPAEQYTMIEQLVGPGPKIELFARERRSGFHAWGSECESPDVVAPWEVEAA